MADERIEIIMKPLNGNAPETGYERVGHYNPPFQMKVEGRYPGMEAGDGEIQAIALYKATGLNKEIRIEIRNPEHKSHLPSLEE